MPRKKDIKGHRYGRLVALKEAPKEDKLLFWYFKCDCGNFVKLQKTVVMSGRAKSCGCLKTEAMEKARLKRWEVSDKKDP